MYIGRRSIRVLNRSIYSTRQSRDASSTHRSRIRVPAPFPVMESCPLPTCPCRPAPEGLEIDREQPLNGTMAAYSEQILVCTGKDDWKSKIEDEEGEHGELVRQLRALLGRGGKFCDPYNNVMLTNSSFPSANPSSSVTSAYLLPSFRYIPSLSNEKSSVENFVKGFLQPTQLHDAHNALPQELKETLIRDPSLQTQFVGVRDVDDILVLICGHGGRDRRCGVLGPLLKSEFEEKLQMKGINATTTSSQATKEQSLHSAQVGLISHIGGHKFAGNLIIYIPPSFKDNPLAGQGLWYGRVGPEHVEGIVQETILEGKVISSMFRGGIKQGGEVIRL
ncbi:hypothetical protein AOQ84DRAFT_284152 [Glonium stellatum]|uniref:Altered inheritance of mitochondria protein 32 n=1 Tax=Glonium stellatum TaxID=574774 RepID=A0A8E2JX72_9PEZI|nr:hypothetical protein AOQ84DRAFT_284152 [Glonium stellatum]